MKLLLYIISLLTLIACGSRSDTHNKATNSTSVSDSLLQQVVDGHNVAMAKIKKLERLTKATKMAIDSINKLPGKQKKENEAYHLQLDQVYKDLDFANFSMNEWMNGFSYDTLANNMPERIKYLQDQREKVNKMKGIVLNSIDKAEGALKYK